MWPASTSTTMPSGSFRASVTIVFRSDPSGLHDITRPPPRSKTNRRAIVVWDAVFSAFELLVPGLIVGVLLIAHLPRLRLHEPHEGSHRQYGIGQFRRC